ncbi:MAG: GNAT family N-acetyltransferase [Hyphomonadaceae bacterium]
MTILHSTDNASLNLPVAQIRGVSVYVVRSIDEYIAVMTIRSRVFQNEQECPYNEEFDGNDLSGATHLLARYNGEPVGVMRLRWFADFAKAERCAVLKSSRAGPVTFALIETACTLAARKGYDKILGHAQRRLAPFWTRRGGGYVRADRPTFWFSNFEYVEVIRKVSPPANKLTLDSPPLELDRPEGDWDRQGVLDRSARNVA